MTNKFFIQITVFLLLLAIPSVSHAKPTLYDFIVGGTIKTLAKIYVRTSNLPKLKAKYIKKLQTMRPDKYKKHYMKFFDVYVQLPADVKKTYAFTPQTTKTELIQVINQVQKKDIIRIINKIPSEFVTKQTRHFSHPVNSPSSVSSRVNETIQFKNLMQRI